MDVYFYTFVGIFIVIIGLLLWSTFREYYIAYRCSLLLDDYIANTNDDPQLYTPECEECGRSGKFVVLYVDPIHKTGKYKQCICGHIEDLPEDTPL